VTTPRTYDLFLTHAWRSHDDWKRMVDTLNAYGLRKWRNFSLPWYDPALDPRTPDGGQVVRRQLETQIIRCHAFLLLSGVYEQAGCRKWVDFEVEVARRYHKPIVGVPVWGHTEPPPDVQRLSDAVVGWDGATIIATIDQLVNERG
jgi:hypothetical protein